MSFSFGPRHPAGAARCGAASLRSKLVWLAGAQSRQCRDVRFALCVVFAEFAKGKLVSLPGAVPAMPGHGPGATFAPGGFILCRGPSHAEAVCTPLQERIFAPHANQGPSGRVCGEGGVFPSG